jgi:hypothetical protein
MDSLQEIQALGETLNTYKKRLEEQQAEISETVERIRELEENTIPQIMDERGIEEVRLADGSSIKVTDFIQARISKANEEAAFQWLRDTHNDGIIKNEVKVALDRGEDERVGQVLSTLHDLGIDADHKQTVHPSTLKAFITEALQNPELRDSIPKDVFGVYEARKVKFK